MIRSSVTPVLKVVAWRTVEDDHYEKLSLEEAGSINPRSKMPVSVPWIGGI